MYIYTTIRLLNLIIPERTVLFNTFIMATSRLVVVVLVVCGIIVDTSEAAVITKSSMKRDGKYTPAMKLGGGRGILE